MKSKIALMICSSILLIGLTGCVTFNKSSRWTHPKPPQTKKVRFGEVQGGFFLSTEEATNLADNTDELKAYIKKLEALIKEMEKYHK